MVFTVLGAVAELERSLICERVKAGLRNARAKGKKLGRPKKVLDVSRISSLHAKGRSWRKIARVMGCSAKTCRRAWQKSRKGFLPHIPSGPKPRLDDTKGSGGVCDGDRRAAIARS